MYKGSHRIEIIYCIIIFHLHISIYITLEIKPTCNKYEHFTSVIYGEKKLHKFSDYFNFL